jgi:hypothetical protein
MKRLNEAHPFPSREGAFFDEEKREGQEKFTTESPSLAGR